MRKKIVPLLAASLAAAILLSGCQGHSVQVDVKADGTGTSSLKYGLIPEAMESLLSMQSSEEEPAVDISSMDTFTIGDTTYVVGTALSGTFTNPNDMFSCLMNDTAGLQSSLFLDAEDISELNDNLGLDFRSSGEGFVMELHPRLAEQEEDFGFDEDAEEMDDAFFLDDSKEPPTDCFNGDQRPVEDGTFTFSFGTDSDTAETGSEEWMSTWTASETTESESVEADFSELEEAAQQQAAIYEFTFPYDVAQASGQTEGITINGNQLTIDIVKLTSVLELGESADCVFTIGNTTYAVAPIFSDVAFGSWYYHAVRYLAEGGLVSGYGTGEFGPEDYLTASQMAELICNAMGLPTGPDETGYWAATAINKCVELAFIPDNGPAVAASYDVVMTREQAVSAMYRAGIYAGAIKEMDTTELGYEIPDFNEIAPAYQLDIVKAYISGVTQGVDDFHTFNPAGILTRAQTCQLFYNLGWTQPTLLNGNTTAA